MTIRGFPYDFRRAPSSVSDGQLVSKLSKLIEDTYNLNRGKKVTLLCHSMGCVHSLWFLTHKDLPWKEKYVRQWIVTGGPFAGVGAAVRRALSGDISTFPFPGLDSLTVGRNRGVKKPSSACDQPAGVLGKRKHSEAFDQKKPAPTKAVKRQKTISGPKVKAVNKVPSAASIKAEKVVDELA